MRSPCPLCGHETASSSWLGKTSYGGKTFEYLRCADCGSLHCEPMPTVETTTGMYGHEYSAFSSDQPSELDHRLVDALVAIDRLPQGTLVDYGCGGGTFLRAALERGWDCVGVEFSSQVADDLGRQLGIPVITPEAASLRGCRADVVVLNDVLEHLTNLPDALRAILGLLRPGGSLVAQGPLEANPNLFRDAVALRRRVKRSTADMPPYHVLLATSQGQERLFARVGLKPQEYRVYEVAWPAPARLTRDVAADPRSVALYLLRRTSLAAGALLPRYSGNRYFYVGTL